MKRWHGAILALALLAPAAQAQFSLYQASCTAGQPVVQLFRFPTTNPNMPDAVKFCLLNNTSSPQSLTLLAVSGVGFTLSGASAPATVPAGGNMNFAVTLDGATTGYYSGALDITGVSPVLLTASVAPGPTYEVQLPSGTAVLGAAVVDFGSVEMGSSTTLNFLAVNQTAVGVTVDTIGVAAGDFALAGASPSGTPLAPQESAIFTIAFTPTAAGARTAQLSIGTWQFTLTGTGVAQPPPQAPFSLYQTSCSASQTVGAQFNFPTVYPDTPESAAFCLSNNTSQTQTVAVLSVSAGFSIPDAAAPMTLKANASVQFTVTFAGAATDGAYTGTLDAAGISVALTANVTTAPALPLLTYEVQLASGGPYTLLAAPVNFGSVQLGSNASLSFLAVNQTANSLSVDSIGVTSEGDFWLVGSSPGGTALAPGTSAPFSIAFSPTVAGARTATLSVGAWEYALTGTGVAASLQTPAPELTLTLGEAHSAQQGTARVSFNPPAESAGSGTVTLSFQSLPVNELDPGIVFANGTRAAAFTFNPGDTAASFGGAAGVEFQTGSTAGTLAFEAQIGSQTSQQSIVIAPAAIDIAAVTGTRQTSTVTPGVTVNVTGFDNTRTAGLLTFTFYDASGNAILPGAINYESAAAFNSYFAGSNDGGQFTVSAYFPIENGAASQVGAFTVALANSVGTTTSAHVSF
jgi:hypothetical protein